MRFYDFYASCPVFMQPQLHGDLVGEVVGGKGISDNQTNCLSSLAVSAMEYIQAGRERPSTLCRSSAHPPPG